jgi:hypothetical protein
LPSVMPAIRSPDRCVREDDRLVGLRGPSALRGALHGARPPGLVLVREPDERGVERAHPQLALGVRLVELAEPNRHVADDDRTPTRRTRPTSICRSPLRYGVRSQTARRNPVKDSLRHETSRPFSESTRTPSSFGPLSGVLRSGSTCSCWRRLRAAEGRRAFSSYWRWCQSRVASSSIRSNRV